MNKHCTSADGPAGNALAGPDQAVLLAAGLPAGLLLLLLLGLAVYHLWKQQQQKCQSQYEELPSTRPSAPGPPAPVILVSQNSWATLVSQTDEGRDQIAVKAH